jgi:hypothetical protein
VFTTAAHDLHKMRRAALSPYFSMATVRSLNRLFRIALIVVGETEGLQGRQGGGYGQLGLRRLY